VLVIVLGKPFGTEFRYGLEYGLVCCQT